jgi:hypothetical protein
MVILGRLASLSKEEGVDLLGASPGGMNLTSLGAVLIPSRETRGVELVYLTNVTSPQLIGFHTRNPLIGSWRQQLGILWHNKHWSL